MDSPPGLKCYKCLIHLFQSKVTLSTNFDGSSEKDEYRLSVPRLKCPVFPLSSQLPAFICKFEEELEKSLEIEPAAGILRDIRDGRVWKEARASNGSPFFSPIDPGALRIGIILHFDG